MGVKIKHMFANTAFMKRLNLHDVRYKKLIENTKLDLYNRLRKVNPMNFGAPYTYYETIYKPILCRYLLQELFSTVRIIMNGMFE